MAQEGQTKAILNLHDFEALAAERLDAGAFAYYAGGALDEVTLRENASAFARRRLRPRVLVDVSALDTATTLLGTAVAAPFGIAPTAQHALAHPEGECATARAAAAAGVLFCASTMSSRTLEDIAEASGGPRWFQLYTQDNDGPRTETLIRRAEAAGYGAIVLTVDLAVPGRREAEMRLAFDFDRLQPGNLALPPAQAEDPIPVRFTWSGISWIRGVTGLPLILKGIMTAEDARLAVEHGVDAVWVSNHGARQLDRVHASVDVLEEVVEAVSGRAEVYLDGGVRRGADVVTALALGARAAFIGRPVLYALAAGGADGVTLALDLLAAELRYNMALLGAATIASITRAHVR
ncbi:MAG: alpha-hydroxy-acid oxidizing protein [Chloroflexota bacterium]|nr:alpha-hydroxy-acid oxidizing protein [Chloroflexota bacterium]